MAAKAKTPKFDALKWVSQAAAREHNRPVLTLAHWNANTSTLACADGYRLFVARGLTPPENLVHGASGDSYVPLKKSHLGGIDGRFPEYSSIIPQFRNYTITLNPARLSEAVKRALVFARDNNNSVRFDIYPELNVIRVSGRSLERGDCETIVNCGIESPGKSISLAFNGAYILDALTGFHDLVELSFKDDKSPLVIGDTSDHFALIMPMGMDRSGNTSQSVPPAPDVPDDPNARSSYFYAPAKVSKPKKKKFAPGGDAGGNARYSMSHDSAESILRTDIYNALSLSAAAHGDPKVEYSTDRGSCLTVHLRYGAKRMFFMPSYRTVGVWDNDSTHYAERWSGVALTGDLVFNVAQAWHWDRQFAPLPAPKANFTTHKRFRRNHGGIGAFRKRARLLSA